MFFQGEGPNILHKVCDKFLADAVKLLKVEIIIGIGRYAENRAKTAVQVAGLKVQVTYFFASYLFYCNVSHPLTLVY